MRRSFFLNPAARSQKAISSAVPPDIMQFESDEFIIRGVTLEGKPFCPGDWAERLCGVMSAFGSEGRMLQYSPYVFPVTVVGIKCVVVRKKLGEIEPMAYEFLLNFAKDNELQTRYGRAPAQGET